MEQFVCKVMTDGKVCGKKFKTKEALGGHVSSTHRDGKVEVVVEPGAGDEAPPQTQPELLSEGEPGIMDSIRDLMRQGFTPKQIKEQFGYAPRTVDQVGAEFIEPEARDGYDNGTVGGLPVITKGTEIITPESIMYRLADGSRDWRMRLEGMMLLRAAQKMVRDDVEIMRLQSEANSKMIEPVLKLMRETREEQDAAAERARGASMDLAREAGREAAEDTAGRVAAYFDGKKVDIASTPNPIMGVMARAMETMWNQVTTKMFGGVQPGQSSLPPGWVDNRQQGVSSASPGSQQGG